MRIAQVAPLYERVPPLLYGGTERIVSYLTEELVRAGHDVTLYASGDSITTANLRAPCARALRLDDSCQDSLAPHVRMLGQVYGEAHQFDIIHCHTDYLGLPLTRYCSTPTLITLHGRLDIPEAGALYCDYPEVPLISISDAQRAPRPDDNWLATIYHGLPLDLYEYQPEPEAYLLFLGRISVEKRPDAAVRVAAATGLRLCIAAKIDKSDRDYYESIRATLDNPIVDFLGEVDDAQKRRLLGKARALVLPIDWPEPFGLVMIEALACGTPVIVRRRGSAPEVVRHGVCGFVCDSEEDMIAAVHCLDSIDRRACREDFERRFSAAVMTDNYLQAYDRVLAAHRRVVAVGERLPARGKAADVDTHGASSRLAK